MGKASFYTMLFGVGLLIAVFTLLLSEDKDGSLANTALYLLPGVGLMLILSLIFGYVAIVKKTNRTLAIVSVIISLFFLAIFTVFLYFAASAITAFT